MNHPFFDGTSYDFSAYSIPVAIVGAMSLGLGLATLLRERRSGASIAFLAMQASVAGWLFITAIIYSTSNREAVTVWFRILPFVLVCIPVGVLAFAVTVSEQWRRLWLLVAASIVASTGFAIAGNAYNSFFTEEIREYFWGYAVIGGPGVGMYALYQTTCLLGAAAILWVSQSQTQSLVLRSRLRALLVALLIAYLSGVDFLASTGIALYPFGYVFIAAFIVLGTRAIWRYRLVDLTPEMAAKEIIETIREAILVVDSDRVIRVANQATADMLGVPTWHLIGARLHDVKDGALAMLAGAHNDGLRTAELDIEGANGKITIIVSASTLRGNTGERLGTIYTAYDITERKQAEQAVAKSESLYRTLVETSPDSVIVTDARGLIVMANEGAARLLRADSPDDLIGAAAFDFVIEEDRERVSETLASVSQSQILESSEYTLQLPNGDTIPVELSLSRVRDASGEVDGFMSVARDISERKRAEATINYLAYHDSLTGLANRSLLVERLSEEMALATADGSSIGLLYMDLDGMKAINDTFGHATGDEVLCDASKRLRALIREEMDILARLGGDEFVLALPGIHSVNEIARVAERVLDAIKQPFTTEKGECTLSMSIGVAVFPRDGEDIEELLARADSAMYAAKDSGGNAYTFASSGGDLARAV